METQLPSSQGGYLFHFRETLKLSTPVIIGHLGTVLMGVIDSMMIGHIGPEYLSAAALASGLWITIAIIGLGLAIALAPLVAEAVGAKNDERVSDYLYQGLLVGLIAGIASGLLVCLGAVFLPEYAILLKQPVGDVILAKPYMYILAFTTLPFLIFSMAKSFTDGLSMTKPAMYITLLGLGVNVLANWVLIYGKWGAPRLELIGAGYGTLISRVLMMAMMLAYIFYHPKLAPYRKRWQGYHREVVSKIFKLGIPTGLQYFFEVAAFVGAMLIAGALGSDERAAHQIAIQLASVTFMIVLGISAGASIRVGDAFGKKDFVNLRKAGFSGIILATAFMSVSALIFVVCRDFLPGFFLSPDSATSQVGDIEYVKKVASSLLLFAAAFQVFDGVQAVGAGILRGVQDVKIPTWVTFFCYWVLALPLGYVFTFILDWGVEGLWAALVLSLMMAAISHIWRFQVLTRRGVAHKARAVKRS